MGTLARWISRFARNDSGQASVEYILVLSIMVMLAISLIRDKLQPLLERLFGIVERKIDQMLFTPDAMHRLRVRR